MVRSKEYSDSTNSDKKAGISTRSLIVFIIIAALGLYIIYLARTAIIPLVIAAAIAYLLAPLVVLLQKKMRKIFAVTITYIIFIAILVITFSIVIPAIIDQFKVFIIKFPIYLESLNDIVGNFQESAFMKGIERIIGRGVIPTDISNLTQSFTDRVILGGDDVIQRITTLTRSVVNIILYFVIGLLLGLYILKDNDKMRTKFINTLPRNLKSDAAVVLDSINKVASRYIRGQLIVSLIVGFLCTVVLWVLKVDFAILFGFIAGILNIIPLLGPIIGAIPAAVAALLISPLKALLVVVFFLVVQQIDNFVISPYVMKYQVGVHPGLIIFSLMFGGILLGMWGLLLAVPIVAILQETLRYFLKERNKLKS